MRYIFYSEYYQCSSKEPLTTVKYNTSINKYEISIESEYITQYTFASEIDCSFRGIVKCDNYKSDDCSDYSEPIKIEHGREKIPLIYDHIRAECFHNGYKIYDNVHSTVPDKPVVKKRLKSWKGKGKPISVLFLGIDTMSRMNFIRTMPKTAKYIYGETNGWYQFNGYNKVAENTFPNLMALLAGLSEETVNRDHNPVEKPLDDAPFIWKDFKKAGYVTAYAEDYSRIETFHYMKKGFRDHPVDYYLRPMMKVADSIFNWNLLHLSCNGFKTDSEHIMDYAMEFVRRFKNDPYFGFFWMNTFSHNFVSDPTSMDERFRDYIMDLTISDLLENTILILGSDHGVRWGLTRMIEKLGFHEDSLPIMFVRLPTWMKEDKRYEKFTSALTTNKNRLTSTYDMHLTIKHILNLSGRQNDRLSAEGCPKCMSLLNTVPNNRSCQEAGIPNHFCACEENQSESTNRTDNTAIGDGVVNYINSKLVKQNMTTVCRRLSLDKVVHNTKIRAVDQGKEYYRINLSTSPNDGAYEANIECQRQSDGEILDVQVVSVFRTNSYADDSKCIDVPDLMQFCSCV
ncbi:hypothetical protein ACFFRR_008513 [Megaselia abdita]